MPKISCFLNAPKLTVRLRSPPFRKAVRASRFVLELQSVQLDASVSGTQRRLECRMSRYGASDCTHLSGAELADG
eukprot:763642-Prymnesium_polylepis.1